MPSIEIIAIGTELLLGEIQDTNTRYLARAVRDAGLDLFQATIIGDNPERIADAIIGALKRADIVITTGGLGPTVDDPTRLAVAIAAGTELEFRPELWEQILNRFKRYGRTATENNRRQAYIPLGSVGIENPVGTAPAFYMEIGNKIVVSLPGVPREMEFLYENNIFPLLREKFDLKQIILAHVLHASGIGESQIDEWIGDLEALTNPTVGLLAHPGQVDIRVTAKANSKEEAEQMIQPVMETIKGRVGDAIYGMDEDTLESVIANKLNKVQRDLVILQTGMNESFLTHFSKNKIKVSQVYTHSKPTNITQLEKKSINLAKKHPASVILSCAFFPGSDQQNLVMGIYHNGIWKSDQRFYGGSPLLGIPWSENSILDFLRRNL